MYSDFMRMITMTSQKIQNKISDIFNVNLIYNHSLGPELSIMLSTRGKPESCMRQVHAGESLILDVIGGIIFMCKVWCRCGPDGDKHGQVAGPITKKIRTWSSTR